MASTNPYKVLHLQLIKNSPNNWKFSYNLISISYKKNCFYLRIAFISQPENLLHLHSLSQQLIFRIAFVNIHHKMSPKMTHRQMSLFSLVGSRQG